MLGMMRSAADMAWSPLLMRGRYIRRHSVVKRKMCRGATQALFVRDEPDKPLSFLALVAWQMPQQVHNFALFERVHL